MMPHDYNLRPKRTQPTNQPAAEEEAAPGHTSQPLDSNLLPPATPQTHPYPTMDPSQTPPSDESTVTAVTTPEWQVTDIIGPHEDPLYPLHSPTSSLEEQPLFRGFPEREEVPPTAPLPQPTSPPPATPTQQHTPAIDLTIILNTLQSLKHDMNANIGSLEQRISTNMNAHIGSIDTKLNSLKYDMNAQIGSLEQNINSNINLIETKLTQKMEEQNVTIERMEEKVIGLDSKFNNQLGQINSEIIMIKEDLEQTKTSLEAKLGLNEAQTSQKLLEIQQCTNAQHHETKSYLNTLEDKISTEQATLSHKIEDCQQSIGQITQNLSIGLEEAKESHTKALNSLRTEVLEQCSDIATEKASIATQDLQKTITFDIRPALENHNTQLVDLRGQVENLKATGPQSPTGTISPREIVVTCIGNGSSPDLVLPKFNGKNQNPQDYLERMQKYCRKNWNRRKQIYGDNGSEQEQMLESIEISLEGHASKWWQMMKGNVRSWDDFERLLQEKYWNRDIQRGRRQQLEMERYHPGGRLLRAEYFIERVITLRSMTPPVPEDEVITLLAEHFDPIIQDAVRVQRITTVHEMEQLLQREDIAEQNQRTRTHSFPGLNLSQPPQRDTNKNTPAPQSPPRYSSRGQQQQNYQAYRPNQNFRGYQPGPRQQPPHQQQYRPQFQRNNHPPQNNPPRSPPYDAHRSYPTPEQRQVCQLYAQQTSQPPPSMPPSASAQPTNNSAHLNA